MKQLGQLLIATNKEPQLSPTLAAAIQLGFVGGVILRTDAIPSVTSLQELIWSINEAARIGKRTKPVILLDLSHSPSALWSMPSLGAMAVSGQTDDVHRIFNTMALLWRQIGITGVIGTDMADSDRSLDPWRDKKTKYSQLFVRELRLNELDSFVRINVNEIGADREDILTAIVDSGLSGAVFNSPSPFRPYSWREHVNFQGLLILESRACDFVPQNIPASINQGFDMVVLPSADQADAAYHALLVGMNQRRLSKRKIYSTAVRIRSLKGLDLPLPWNPSVIQRPIQKWAQHIWDHSLAYTGSPYSTPSSKLMLIEFGHPSPLKNLLEPQLSFYRLFDIDPDIRDMFQILSLAQQEQDQLIIHLNDASHHLNQTILFPLCQPRPLGIAMNHPSDLFLLPPDATGLTNFDSHPSAYQSLVAAIMGKISIREHWLSPQEVPQS